jgi:hypothetical protein
MYKLQNRCSPFLSFQNALKIENLENVTEDIDEKREEIVNLISEEFL